MRLTLTQFMTLDGVVQGPGRPDEDRSEGFAQGGWSVRYADEDFGRLVGGWFERADAFLLGRRTYDIFAAFWPRVDAPADPVATRLNRLPKYVASQTLDRPSWQGTTVLTGNVAERVAELKRQEGGEVQVHGSGTLAQYLLAHGLIDELRLAVHPVVLGNGRRLFAAGGPPAALRLTGVTTTASGIVAQVYEPAGEPEYGTMPSPGA